ncbi:hypothetical protein DFP72DRAFT_885487 [Ephemerocybe angulata]|uniref:Uncharacterized protein n=1 Tax=Ephemerocybe angulata TaxID=980116 RepID=A0A8H6I626_9AGAR|nr:hypothetical protein DFP72DRAFT_885487 [Tulosesus angulatus]
MPVPSRPIPNAVSFSAPTTSTTALSLTYILHNTTPSELHTRLLNAVSHKQGGASAVLALSGAAITDLLHTLSELGFNTAHARAAVSDATRRHCVRCHSAYLEKDNGVEACRVAHEEIEVQDPEKFGRMVKWVACCGVKLAEGAKMDNEWCFVGRHTTTQANVVYNASNVTECNEAKGCPGAMGGLEWGDYFEEWQEGDEPPVPIGRVLPVCYEDDDAGDWVPTQPDIQVGYAPYMAVLDEDMGSQEDQYSDFLDFEGAD